MTRWHRTRANHRRCVADADLVVGGVLLPGARGAEAGLRGDDRRMRTGSVVVDVAIDQGGCFETAKPTSHSEPTYEVYGVIHYCVTNMPGAVPAPARSRFPMSPCRMGWRWPIMDWLTRLKHDPALATGINVLNGHITYQAVADAFGSAILTVGRPSPEFRPHGTFALEAGGSRGMEPESPIQHRQHVLRRANDRAGLFRQYHCRLSKRSEPVR